MFIRVPPFEDRKKKRRAKPDDDIYVGITPEFVEESDSGDQEDDPGNEEADDGVDSVNGMET
jgi:hypothetical protein